MLEACLVISLVVAVQAEMEGFIVGGDFAPITMYPHSAFLAVVCVKEDKEIVGWICGASVLNQWLLLSAGHCTYSCSTGTYISVNLGDENRLSGVKRSASGFLLHEKYEAVSSNYDISMIKLLRPLEFSSKIRRVAIMKRPPYNEVAHVAGWGLTDEKSFDQKDYLKHIDQKVWKHAACEKMLGGVPKGTICASSSRRNDLAAQGDSGSALMVRGYIQIGLVSFKVPGAADNVIVYTDIGYHYDWIDYNSERLYCFSSLK